MLKALAWKEYREQRQIALMGLLVSAMLPVLFIAVGTTLEYGFNPRDILFFSATAGVSLVWPIFATVAGAATNLREAHVGSLGFLLSRPISRGRIWAVKVGLGLASLTTVVLGSVVIFWAIPRLFWGPGIVSRVEPLAAPGMGLVAGFLTLAFACAALYTTLTASPLVAAGAGLVTSFAIHAFVLGFWSIVGLRRGYERVTMIEVGIVILLAFAGSVYAFKQGELLRGPRMRRMVLTQAVIAVGVLFVVSSTLAFALTRVNLSNAVFTDPELSPAGDVVVVRADRDNRSAEQIWRIDLEGDASQLTARRSRDPAFSPDGKWLAYSGWSFFYGFPPLRIDLRLARSDGSEDRRLGRSMGGYPVFSPDGTKLATAFWGGLSIAHLDRDTIETIELAGASGPTGRPRVRWTPDGNELLFHLRPTTTENQTLVFYDLESGESRIFDRPSDWMTVFNYSLPAARPVPSRMPVAGHWLARPDGTGHRPINGGEFGIGLIDRETLSSEILVRGTCSYVLLDLSVDERFLAYATCAEQDQARAVRLRDLDTGEDRPLATMKGRISSLRFNPSGTHVLVSTGWTVSRPHDTAIVAIDGETRALGDFVSLVGWLDDRRVLLARHPARFDRRQIRRTRYLPQSAIMSLVIYDIETDEEQTVFSR